MKQPRFWPCPMHYTGAYCGGILALLYRGTAHVYECQNCAASWRSNGDPIKAPKLGK